MIATVTVYCQACGQQFQCRAGDRATLSGIPVPIYCPPCDEDQRVGLAESDVAFALSEIGPEAVLRIARDWCRQQVGFGYTEREWIFRCVADDLDAALMSAEKLGVLG